MKFDSYHPAINLIFFTVVLTCTVSFNQPFFLAISFLSALIYSVKLGGRRALLFNLALLPCVVAYTIYYASYNHFGITNLAVNSIGNSITLEAIVYGLVRGITAACAVMWFSCIHAIVTSDKVIYLFGCVSPRLSLFLTVILRMVPRIKHRATAIATAQKGIGRGGVFRIASMVITWTVESFSESTQSMRSRGYTLRGRTAYSIYRFDGRDRSFVITIFFCLTAILMAVLFDQTRILYSPEIIVNRITPLSYAFYAAYAFLCLLPLMLQCAGEMKMKKQIEHGEMNKKKNTAQTR